MITKAKQDQDQNRDKDQKVTKDTKADHSEILMMRDKTETKDTVTEAEAKTDNLETGIEAKKETAEIDTEAETAATAETDIIEEMKDNLRISTLSTKTIPTPTMTF